MLIEVRRAVYSDCAAIAEICTRDLGYECGAELISRKLSALDPDKNAVFCAVADSAVIGFIHAEKYDTLYTETFVNILGLAVRSEYHRHGAGRLLLREAEKWAAMIGAYGVRLNSGGARTEAHKFYRSQGYSSEKVQLRFLKKL